MSADQRRGRDKERRRKMKDNEDGAVKSTGKTSKEKVSKGSDLEAAARELRSKFTGSSRDRRIFNLVGRPNADSLELVNKGLFATIQEVLITYKKLDRYIDPEKVDWDLPIELREAKTDYAERKLKLLLKKATTIKLLCDGVVRAAKVQAEMDLDTLPDRLILEGVATLDDRLGITDEEAEVDTVH